MRRTGKGVMKAEVLKGEQVWRISTTSSSPLYQLAFLPAFGRQKACRLEPCEFINYQIIYSNCVFIFLVLCVLLLKCTIETNMNRNYSSNFLLFSSGLWQTRYQRNIYLFNFLLGRPQCPSVSADSPFKLLLF